MKLSEYESMLTFQGGTCAVCFLPEACVKRGKVLALAVHHDHTTGKNVALLCHGCNVGMGMLKDDPELLHRAAALMEHSRATIAEDLTE